MLFTLYFMFSMDSANAWSNWVQMSEIPLGALYPQPGKALLFSSKGLTFRKVFTRVPLLEIRQGVVSIVADKEESESLCFSEDLLGSTNAWVKRKKIS